jgi:hypothetical protein
VESNPIFYPSFTCHFRTKGNKSKNPNEHTFATKYEKVAVSIIFYSHLEAYIRWLRTRRSGVRISSGRAIFLERRSLKNKNLVTGGTLLGSASGSQSLVEYKPEGREFESLGARTFLERRSLKNKNLVNWQPLAGECLWAGSFYLNLTYSRTCLRRIDAVKRSDPRNKLQPSMKSSAVSSKK